MARRSGSPVAVALAAVIIVAMGLAVVWQWAEARSFVAPDPLPAARPLPPAPATPLLSIRRAPGVLARRLNLAQFAEEFDRVIDAVDVTSCLAVSVDGQEVIAKNRAVAVVPASTMKIIVGAVALQVLGSGYQFTTRVVGTIGAGGVIDGDLAIIGGGDPLLSTDWWTTSPQQARPPTNATRLEDLADAVVAAGVVRVNGRVVGDGSRYDDEFFAPSWGADVRIVEAGPYDALLVNDGRTTARATDVTPEPALGAAEVFTQLLRERGVRVGRGAAAETVPFTGEIAAVTSQPLSAVVGEMMLTSDDNTAEMLVKEIGLETSGAGTTRAGLEAVISQLLAWDVSIDGVLLVDGSGLSRDNRLTCGALLGVLQHHDPAGPLGAALPVAAVSGTLAESFGGSPVAGRLLAKTGTLSGVKALAGYLPVPSGGTIQFALIQNTPGVDQGAFVPVWDALATAMASYPAAASEDDLAPR